MELKITAIKQKSSYCKTDSSFGYVESANAKGYYPFFELMLKELEKHIHNNTQTKEN